MDNQKLIENLKIQIQISLAWSAWWITFANSPANFNRRMYVGGSNTLLTKEELIDNALSISENHIRLASECQDKILAL